MTSGSSLRAGFPGSSGRGGRPLTAQVAMPEIRMKRDVVAYSAATWAARDAPESQWDHDCHEMGTCGGAVENLALLP